MNSKNHTPDISYFRLSLMVSDLHKLIRENSKNEQEYKRYFDSLKSSVLTAFYTPPEIIKTIEDFRIMGMNQ